MSGTLRSTPTEAVLQGAGLETVADRHDAAALCLYDRWRGLLGETTGEREVRQRTNKESWRHRYQNVLEPLVEKPREHLAESSRNNKGVSLTRVCPGSRRREEQVWWWKREETSCAYNRRPQRLPDTGLLRRRPWRQRRRHGNWLDRRILVALLWSLKVSPLYERRRERAEGRLGVLRSALWPLKQKSWTMKILWVPGHYFLWENERSDEEARRGRNELLREESVNLSLQVRPPHGLRQLRALEGRQESAEGRFCGEENETAQHLWVWCSAFMEERWRAWFGESLWELVETPLRASAVLKAILRCLKWSTTKTAPPRQHLPLRDRHNILFLQLLLIFCLYLCSTYKCDGICNILSLRALLADQLIAFNASHRVHNKPYDHRLHKGISQSDSTESHSLRQGSSSFCCLPSGLFFSLQLYTC